MKKNFWKQQKLLAGKRRTMEANKSLGRCLAFIAGAINAGGFLVVNQYTSHMTGILSLAVDSIALNHWLSATTMLLYIACFIIGAATTAMLVIWGRNHHLHSQYALPLALEALLLMIFGIMNSQLHSNAPYIVGLLCYLMGLQNAVITKISSTTIRTTHVTGMVTDIGIEIGKIIFSGLSNRRTPKPNKDKISLHLSIVSAFMLGGISGAYGFNYIGFLTVLPLAGYLLFIAYLPIRKDWIIRKNLDQRARRNTIGI